MPSRDLLLEHMPPARRAASECGLVVTLTFAAPFVLAVLRNTVSFVLLWLLQRSGVIERLPSLR